MGNDLDGRRHILAIGEALILSKGFTRVGLAELLAAAQVPKGSFYYYFTSKEQFGEALLNNYFSGYLQRLEALLAADGRPARERLMDYWQLWVEIQGRGPCAEQCMVVKLSAEVADLSEPMRLALLQGTGLLLARLTACFQEGVEDGSLPPELDPGATVLALYELWLGASLLTKVRREPSALLAALATTQARLASHP
jgi:TetR/AcrR family transcriptional repressor of nem operon